jgi:flagella basal body P-ring formation protein FlgA
MGLWSTAVVVDDSIRLSDLCDLGQFSSKQESGLRDIVVTSAPPPGGSRVIHMDMVRSALDANEANLARITFSGATECLVTRPRTAHPGTREPRPSTSPTYEVGSPPAKSERAIAVAEELTLRHEVIDHLDQEFARYGGTADVTFDRTSTQILDLSKPEYTFKVRRRPGRLLGLVQLEVDVLADDRIVQAVPLVVQVSLVRPVVVARRAINQDATIGASDVQLEPISFTRLDQLGLDDTSLVIGQRAKRFISAGSQIEPAMLEPIPLVTRGQLVTLRSVAGLVSIVTTATALQDGLHGEMVTVRSADKKRTQFDAVVVGPGAVQIGARASRGLHTRLAMGGDS